MAVLDVQAVPQDGRECVYTFSEWNWRGEFKVTQTVGINPADAERDFDSVIAGYSGVPGFETPVEVTGVGAEAFRVQLEPEPGLSVRAMVLHVRDGNLLLRMEGVVSRPGNLPFTAVELRDLHEAMSESARKTLTSLA